MIESLFSEMSAIRNEVPLMAVVNSRLRNHGETFEEMSRKGIEALRKNTDIELQLFDYSLDLVSMEECRRSM
jgi:hypothetical protein